MADKRKRRRLKLLEQKVERTKRSRPCDGCTACCTAMGVLEFEKPPGTACAHVGEGCCTVYETRPPSCQEFYCLWRMGLGSVEDRPDRTGIVFDHARQHVLEGQAIVAREAWPGAFNDSRDLLERYASVYLIFLVSGDAPRRVLGPEDKVLRVQGVIQTMMRQRQAAQ